MRRRQWLKIIAASGLVAGAATWGMFYPVTDALRASARRLRRVPHDLVARIHRRTRPLDPDRLRVDDELLG